MTGELLDGQRLLFKLLAHFLLGWLIIGVAVHFLGGVGLASVLLGVALTLIVATLRTQQMKSRIKGNHYFEPRANLKVRLSLDGMLILIALLLGPFLLAHTILTQLILFPLAMPFPLTACVQILWLLKYEARFGPVYIAGPGKA